MDVLGLLGETTYSSVTHINYVTVPNLADGRNDDCLGIIDIYSQNDNNPSTDRYIGHMQLYKYQTVQDIGSKMENENLNMKDSGNDGLFAIDLEVKIDGLYVKDEEKWNKCRIFFRKKHGDEKQKWRIEDITLCR